MRMGRPKGESGPPLVRSRHIKKRALKNKSLSVSFNEKDLKDFVTGFHKRKKKRRKEAMQKQEEAERRKRIEQRKKRKLERDFVQYGGPPPSDAIESDEEHEDEEAMQQGASVSGKAMYDNGDLQITVTTSEIARELDYPIDTKKMERVAENLELIDKSRKRIPVKKKQLKKSPKKRSHPKPRSKREKRNGKTKKNS
ncbi:ribosomal RNA-processing protein 17 [Dorcoceras hygrometricum]|uniref:Ribosomal RNA-processing protein 17 n=1 Tax=Dorcoceras hygrometricum TaxID=472368 RepID=A0A2Z7CQG3_9LAMI|nr:ribosomal RNA-processing protein 17 [Dorcoceras hygrometricum]